MEPPKSKKHISWYEVVNENGTVIVIRKTEKGIKSWKEKNDVHFDGRGYTLKGKPIWIDFHERYV